MLRSTLVEIGERVGRKDLKLVASVALPDTILAWHRRLIAQKFDGSKRRSYPPPPPGFNLFDSDDEALLIAIARGEFNISGMQNKTLRRLLPDKNGGRMSRLLKRLRVHGLIKKVGHTYKYYLTRFGKAVITTGLKLRELVIVPQLALNSAV